MTFDDRIRYLLDSSRPVDQEIARFVTFQTPDREHNHEAMIGQCQELIDELAGLKKLLTPPVLKICQDPDPSDCNPRDWDNLGTMVCWHNRYELGDDQPRESPIEWLEAMGPFFVKLPLYLIDHSGISMSTASFNDPWDSGQVGLIVVKAEDVRKEFKVKALNGALKKKVTEILEQEVRVYDQYLRGAVWGFTYGDESCWGFHGDELEETGFLDAIDAPREVIEAAWEARS